MNEQQLLNLIGLAYRARKLSLGVDTISKDIQNERIYFVLIATDIEKNSKKQLIDKCHYYEVPYGSITDRYTLGNALGKQPRVAIGITERGFAQKCQSLLQN